MGIKLYTAVCKVILFWFVVDEALEICLKNGVCLFVYASVNSENQWFLSSSLWPCEPADLESRTRVLTRLAEKTSHRDTLDVLCNLPGLKEPNGERKNLFVLCIVKNPVFSQFKSKYVNTTHELKTEFE